METLLSPASPRVVVQDADDPYKKFWFALIAGFAFTAFWLLSPMLGEKSVGSGSYAPGTSASIEQSLIDGGANGAGDVSGDFSAGTAENPAAGSMLYQSVAGDSLEGGAKLEEAAAAALAARAAGGASASGSEGAGGTAGGAAVSANLADALKKVGESGWSEKPQRGFAKAHLKQSGLSGLGAASGSRSVSGGIADNAFGRSNSQVSFSEGAGFRDLGDGPSAAGRGLSALKAAEAMAAGASASGGEAAFNKNSRTFDGAKEQKAFGGPGSPGGASFGAYDAAPKNLKLADPKLNAKNIALPEPKQVPLDQLGRDAAMRQMAIQMAGIVIGGLIGGTAGGIVMQMAQAAAANIGQQQQQQVSARNQQALDRAQRAAGGQ